MPAKIRGILLAAGYSKRFGSNKLLQALPPGGPDAGVPIALAAAKHLLEILPDSIAVVRPRAQKLAALLRDAGCNTVVCRNAAQGMGTSLAAGVRASDGADGWVVALADMPFIRPETIRAVVSAVESGAPIAAPSYRGQRGHPVGFGKACFEDLSALAGDHGARELLGRHAGSVMVRETDDAGVLRDIDRPSDL
ncbi:MAG TPA: nucleotidyltransferase family protein [Burkholderiales bacterium]|nr:nucleotidyltransferase family protein [Burkholderiales bacterium]